MQIANPRRRRQFLVTQRDGLSATLQVERMKTLAAHDGPAQEAAKAYLSKLKARRGD